MINTKKRATVGFGRVTKIARTFSYFGLLAKSHPSKTNMSKSALSTCHNFFTMRSQNENYFVVKQRGVYVVSLTLVKQKISVK